MGLHDKQKLMRGLRESLCMFHCNWIVRFTRRERATVGEVLVESLKRKCAGE